MQLQIPIEELKNYKSRAPIPLKCEQCGKQLLLNNEIHECSSKKTTYWISRICKKKEFCGYDR